MRASRSVQTIPLGAIGPEEREGFQKYSFTMNDRTTSLGQVDQEAGNLTKRIFSVYNSGVHFFFLGPPPFENLIRCMGSPPQKNADLRIQTILEDLEPPSHIPQGTIHETLLLIIR